MYFQSVPLRVIFWPPLGELTVRELPVALLAQHLEDPDAKRVAERFELLGLVDEAIPWYEQSIAVSENHGFRRFTARTRHNLGICYRGLGDYEKAGGNERQQIRDEAV